MSIQGSDKHLQAQSMESYYTHPRPEVLELIPADARRVLDIGCSSGELSASLKARQPAEVHGVELFTEAAERARVHLDQVWNSTIEEALPSLPDKHYDCIVIADVLEHLLDPWAVLAALKNKLADGGKLVASIPNIQNWEVLSELIQGKWDYRSEGILDRTHLRFFTRKSVEELFWNAGFRIASLTTTNRGPALTEILMDSFASAGLSAKSLEQDNQAFQFLVVAEVPNLAVMPRVAIVVLNWNGKADTLECLASIRQLDYPNYEVVVVDNGSTDDSVEALSKQYSDMTLLQTGANLGYAGGNNVGIRWAMDHGADYLLILNNDTIVSTNLLSAFINAENILPTGSVLGAKIYYHDKPDAIWFAGARWRNESGGFEHIGSDQKDGSDFDHIIEIDYVTGCALFASASVFREVGLLNEDFFLTYEETDWCYRAKAKGHKCLFIPDAKLWHKVSSSFGGAESPLVAYFMTRNKLFWARKHLAPVDRKKLHKQNLKTLRNILWPPFVMAETEIPLAKRGLWSLSSWLKNVRRNLSNPTNKATLMGLRDYYLGRFGDSPDSVRKLPKPTGPKVPPQINQYQSPER